MDLKGLMLHGRYEVLEQTGTLGLAGVWKVRDAQSPAFLTALILEPPTTSNTAVVRRFLRSTELASPYSVPVEASGQDQGICDLVLHPADPHETLAELESKSGPLPASKAAWICSCVLSALESMLALGGLPFHGALSPESVLVMPSGDAQVMGFGTSSLSGRVDPLRAGRLTPYAAPEQREGRAVDIRADLYATGVLMFQMLTGSVPGAEASVEGTPEELQPVLSGLLQPDPELRYSSPADVLNAIAERGFPVPERPGAGAEPPGREHGPSLGLRNAPGVEPGISLTGMNDFYHQEAAGPEPEPAPSPEPVARPLGVSESREAEPVDGAAWVIAPPPETGTPVAPLPASRGRRWIVPVVVGVVAILAVVGFVAGRQRGVPPDGTAVQPGGGVTVTTGSIDVSSTPSGATILLDGAVQKAKTPALLKDVQDGTHELVLRLNGYKDAQKSVSVTAGGTVAVSMTLTRAQGTTPSTPSTPSSSTPTQPSTPPATAQTTIRVTSTPSSAAILLDGRSTGKRTPASLVVAPGPHTVTLQLSGYNQASRTVTAVKGRETSASITLTRPAPVAQGSLKVISTPAGATVTVDGKAVKGVTPLTVSVALGSHTVKVALSGYQTVTRTGVNVVKGIQTVTAVTLVPVTQLVSYTDSTYGYGFKYPSTWQVAHVAGGTEVRAPTGPRVRVAVAPLGGKTVQAFAAGLHDALQQQGGLTVTSPATQTIAGIQYQHFAAAGGGTTTDYYLLASGGSVYQLECSAATDAAGSAAADFRAILGSFFAAP